MITPNPKIRLLFDHPSWKEFSKYVNSIIQEHRDTLNSPILDKSLEQKVREDEVARKCIKNLEDVLKVELIKDKEEPKSMIDKLH